MNLTQSTAEGRTESFSRNNDLESLLKDINSSLFISEKKILENQKNQRFPVVLIMGPMRSGTTLFMQWLANTGLFAYPTNLLSRFYQAPVIGAKIQLMLTDPRYNFRDELGEFVQQTGYSSENGKTKGVLAPNEFWYFWRRFLAEPSRDVWTDDELRQSMDVKTMKAELNGLMEVFQKPFVAKNLLFNYNIPFLDSIFESVIFIQIKRDIVTNISSVLDARKKQSGSESEWYSFKIPEYKQLKNLDALSQSVGQVHYINTAVTKGLESVSESRKMIVDYEDFCQDPRRVFNDLVERLDFNKNSFDYSGPQAFTKTRESNRNDRKQIEEILFDFQ